MEQRLEECVSDLWVIFFRLSELNFEMLFEKFTVI